MVYKIGEIKYTSCYQVVMQSWTKKANVMYTEQGTSTRSQRWLSYWFTYYLFTYAYTLLLFTFFPFLYQFYINFISDESRASNHPSSTRSRRGFCRRTGSSTRSCRGFFSWIDSFLDLGQGFSRRAKTHTRTRRVVLSPRLTDLIRTSWACTANEGPMRIQYKWLVPIYARNGTSRQCCGSMTFWCGSRSVDLWLWLMDPDPSISVINLQDANKN
jgi:hypothetical protein